MKLASPRPMRSGADFKIGSDSVFWCEHPDTHLRRVGYSDECSESRSLRYNRGYYVSEDDCGEVARGVVFQLPGKNGSPRFMYGVADPFNDGPVMLSHDITECKANAAIWADQLAQCYAESEREYQEISNAGFQYRELGEEIAAQRRDTLALISEAKGFQRALRGLPETRRLIAQEIKRYLRETRRDRKKRAELLAMYGKSDGFND